MGHNPLVNTRKTADSDPADGPERNGTVSEENRAVAERLQRLVRETGGVKALSDRSGVPFGTLRNYLAGRPLRVPALTALSGAAGVSIEWLATGRGPMRPGAQAPVPPSEPSNLFGTLDIDRMARAMEKAFDLFAERGHRPSMRRLAQVVLLLYDDFTEPRRPDRRVSGLVDQNEGESDALS